MEKNKKRPKSGVFYFFISDNIQSANITSFRYQENRFQIKLVSLYIT